MGDSRAIHRKELRWESGIHLAICLVAGLVAGGAWYMLENSGTDKWNALRTKVTADAEVRGAPTALRDDAVGLLEIGDGFMKIFVGGCALVVGMAVVGVIREVRTLRITVPLLAANAEGDGPGTP